jgi:type II secretory pathway component PulJ
MPAGVFSGMDISGLSVIWGRMSNNIVIRKIKISCKGFTLLETLMALFLLMSGVVGAYAVLSKAIRTSPIARQQYIASNLAQEAIEMVRNIRDRRMLLIADRQLQTPAVSEVDWSQDIQACNPANQWKSRVELSNVNDISSSWDATDCSGGPNGDWAKVYREPVSGYWANLCQSGGNCGSVGWVDTGFRRRMLVEKYVCADGSCSAFNQDNNCTNDCAEVRVKVRVYWGSDANPAAGDCPGEFCVVAEDRLTNWVDYMKGFLQ